MTEGENRVLIDLPLRLQKAQAAAFKLEKERDAANEKLAAIRTLIAMREQIGDDTAAFNGVEIVMHEDD